MQLSVQTPSHVFYGGSRFTSSVPVTIEQEFALCSGPVLTLALGDPVQTQHLGSGRM